MPTGELVLREDADGVTLLTLNRPNSLNALSAALFEELRAHVDAIRKAGDAVACVILNGAGRAFCAGADKELVTAARDPVAIRRRAETMVALSGLPQPVIAAVHGHCCAGGLELALSADFIIAATSASFVDFHAKLGGTPRWGLSVRLPRRVGVQAAKDIMFTGRRVSGAEAAEIGLALRCVDDADLLADCRAMAAQIKAGHWSAVAGCKHLIEHQVGQDLIKALEYERSRD